MLGSKSPDTKMIVMQHANQIMNPAIERSCNFCFMTDSLEAVLSVHGELTGLLDWRDHGGRVAGQEGSDRGINFGVFGGLDRGSHLGDLHFIS